MPTTCTESQPCASISARASSAMLWMLRPLLRAALPLCRERKAHVCILGEGEERGRLEELWGHYRFYWLEREVLPDLKGEDEAMVCAVMASDPDPGAPRYYERLVELARNREIADSLAAQRPEVERWAKALGMVWGFPERLRPLAEMLKRLEAERGKR